MLDSADWPGDDVTKDDDDDDDEANAASERPGGRLWGGWVGCEEAAGSP
jgi:hypothetical protein